MGVGEGEGFSGEAGYRLTLANKYMPYTIDRIGVLLSLLSTDHYLVCHISLLGLHKVPTVPPSFHDIAVPQMCTSVSQEDVSSC